ncbi:MAG: hypothetical protein D6790_11655 [Caldilineae bacterium]|nr:MAG: hypothetical protein D6790_11655 [Caldilineae bacterium]
MRPHQCTFVYLRLLILATFAWSVAACTSEPLAAEETPISTVFFPVVTATPPSTPAPGSAWSAIYGGEGFEEMEGLIVTQEGGLVITGATDSYNDSEEGDAWILKLAGDGQIVWQRTYGGDKDESILDIRQLPDGGFIAAGWTQSFGVSQTDFWLMRLDAQGRVLWAKTYGGPGVEQAWSVDLTGDGGFVVAGGTTSFGAGAADYWVLRLDKGGNVVWQKSYGGPKDDGGGGDYEEYVVRVLVDRDGNYVLASESASFGAGETDIWMLKLGPDGSIIWQKAYGGEYEDGLWSFIEAADGGYIAPGSTVSFSPDVSGDTWVLRLNPDGSIRWQKVFGLANYWDEALSVGATRDGGAVIGAYDEEGTTDWDMLLLRVDADGGLTWQRRYEYGWDWPNAIAEMPGGSLAMAGVAWDNDHGQDLDLWVMRLNADGSVAGSCDVVQTLQVQQSESTSTPTDTHATVQDTHATSQVVTPTVRDTSAAPRYLCPSQ